VRIPIDFDFSGRLLGLHDYIHAAAGALTQGADSGRLAGGGTSDAILTSPAFESGAEGSGARIKAPAVDGPFAEANGSGEATPAHPIPIPGAGNLNQIAPLSGRPQPRGKGAKHPVMRENRAKELGAALAEKMQVMGVTGKALAGIADVSESTVSYAKAGDSGVSSATVERMLDALHGLESLCCPHDGALMLQCKSHAWPCRGAEGCDCPMKNVCPRCTARSVQEAQAKRPDAETPRERRQKMISAENRKFFEKRSATLKATKAAKKAAAR